MTFDPGPYPADAVAETVLAFLARGDYISVKQARHKPGRPVPTAKHIVCYLQTGESPRGRNIDAERDEVNFWDVQAAVELISVDGDGVSADDLGEAIGTVIGYLHFDSSGVDKLRDREWVDEEIGDRIPKLRVVVDRNSHFTGRIKSGGWRTVALTEDGRVVTWFRPATRDYLPLEPGTRVELRDVRVVAKTEHDGVKYSKIDHRYAVTLKA